VTEPTVTGALEAEHVSVRFGGLRALEDVSLTLAHGELLGLIGPNGAGKSTLINALSGFEAPAEGVIRLDGRTLAGHQPHEVSRAGVARTFQAVRLFRGLSVLENVAAGLVLRRASRRAATKRAREILDWMGLAPKADVIAGTLPYGDERRIGIARALATEPRYLLLDEPAAGSNEDEIAELASTITRIRADFGCGVLVVEHNMALIMALSERIHVIDGGRTIAIGTPAEVQRDPAVRRAYLGEDED
jgi:branched-chain amino acid transport system ATP-binding protein